MASRADTGGAGRSAQHLAGGAHMPTGISVAIPSLRPLPRESPSVESSSRADGVARAGAAGPSPGCIRAIRGGHLAACLLATDWPALDATLSATCDGGAFAISGLLTCAACVETSINKADSLTMLARRAARPVVLERATRGKGSIDWVGGRERRENESAENRFGKAEYSGTLG